VERLPLQEVLAKLLNMLSLVVALVEVLIIMVVQEVLVAVVLVDIELELHQSEVQYHMQ
tara:strand:+ start:693 stop:869 length:177 start_codon:yes stop_codon:yes gene_type:complete